MLSLTDQTTTVDLSFYARCLDHGHERSRYGHGDVHKKKDQLYYYFSYKNLKKSNYKFFIEIKCVKIKLIDYLS